MLMYNLLLHNSLLTTHSTTQPHSLSTFRKRKSFRRLLRLLLFFPLLGIGLQPLHAQFDPCHDPFQRWLPSRHHHRRHRHGHPRPILHHLLHLLDGVSRKLPLPAGGEHVARHGLTPRLALRRAIEVGHEIGGEAAPASLIGDDPHPRPRARGVSLGTVQRIAHAQRIFGRLQGVVEGVEIEGVRSRFRDVAAFALGRDLEGRCGGKV
mmetsp:Transcript_2576/g.3939  ORF Transcript_2576/g.3939 Transcript_2576/m.3939 type:complete len:208 (+) Transcript_2576:196-819(+)